MKVLVDHTKCQGHARCWTLAPDLFRLDEGGYIVPGDVEIPEGQETLAGRAVRSCPERALTAEGGTAA